MNMNLHTQQQGRLTNQNVQIILQNVVRVNEKLVKDLYGDIKIKGEINEFSGHN